MVTNWSTTTTVFDRHTLYFLHCTTMQDLTFTDSRAGMPQGKIRKSKKSRRRNGKRRKVEARRRLKA